jgi:hypothetical protein
MGGRVVLGETARPPNEFSRRRWKEPASLCDIYAGPGTKVPDNEKNILDRLVLSLVLAQLIALNFSRSSLWQLLDELNYLRTLIRGQPRPEMLYQFQTFCR